ncbi:MAG: LamG-like jellyroll fold domain-containing protein, partial [Bacteroidota bacterium]
SNLPGDIVRYDNCVTESGWGLRIGYNNPGQIQGLEFDNTRNPNFVTSNNVYNDGNWHLAVFKRDVSAMKDALFIDNQFITETSFSTVYNIDITGHPLFIGAGCDFFNGDLDDIGIWNRALNQQEITNFFNSSQSSSNCLPSYVPINGLIGYWPFCGNANDESGNGNNGIVYPNTTLTSDRNNFPLSAYLFDNSVQSGIQTNIPLSYTLTGISGALWFNSSVFLNSSAGHRQFISGTNGIPFQFAYNNGGVDLELYDQNGSLTVFTWPAIFLQNTWHHVVFSVNTSGNVLIAIDGQLNNSGTAPNSLRTATNSTFVFGLSSSPFWPNPFPGKLDDIGIWNRALTQQEVTNLYNATNCANNTTITPQTNTITAGSTANFTATTSDPNPAYVWQSDLGQGFQTLNNFGNYSGVNTASIHISNVQLSEHNQPIRVITTSGNCIDTSNVASILVSDTCITTMTDTSIVLITDTNIVTVTDTNYVTIVDTNYVTVNDTS